MGPYRLLEALVSPNVLDDKRVEEWRKLHPREWWAFNHLDPEDELRDRVLAAVLGERTGHDEALDGLVRFADALEHRQKVGRRGAPSPPPGDGERRPFQARVTRMVRMASEGRTFYRVDFATPYGWSGMFDTTNPELVERVSKQRDRSKPITLVGEITERPYDFLVVLGARVRIV